MSEQSEIPAAVEHAVLEQTRQLQAAYARGDEASARAALADLTARYGLTVIAEVMARRDERQRLGVEVENLRLFGGCTLYGDGRLPQ